MIDRIWQALYSLALDPVVDTISDPNSYGFRPKRSTQDAREQCFIALAKRNQAQWILEGDIAGCFDNISHQWLVKNTPMEKRILARWLKAGFMDKGCLYETKAGTPQGGLISPNLANIALNGLEKAILGKFTQRERSAKKINVVRYADDFIVTGLSEEILEREVKPTIVTFLKERGLSLSEEKTRITSIEKGFDFLGFNVRKYNGKLLIKPSKKSIKNVTQKIGETFKAHKTARTCNLIRLLNPIIRGWANYYRGSVSKKTFDKIDHVLWLQSWKWAKRRHPKKSKQWITNRYYTRKGNRSWILTGKDGDKEALLTIMAKTPIKRHVKIKGNANPYDLEWEAYFEKRWERQWLQKGRFRQRQLWVRQEGLCPACRQRLEFDDELDIHHLKPIANGGTDSLINLMLLHTVCHRQIHYFHGKEASPGELKRLILA